MREKTFPFAVSNAISHPRARLPRLFDCMEPLQRKVQSADLGWGGLNNHEN
jgi:hypothetical protein